MAVCYSRAVAFAAVILAVGTHVTNAQNANDFLNVLGGVMQQAMRQAALAEWQKLPPTEISCLDQSLQQQGQSVNGLITRGVLPSDPRLSELRVRCRAASPTVSPSNANAVDIENLSSKPTFDCAKARRLTAIVVCLDLSGAQADWDLNSAYWAKYFSLSESDRQAFDQAQQRWIDSLNVTCQSKPQSQQRQCILSAYQNRASGYRNQLNEDALAESRLTPEQHAKIQQSLVTLGFLDDTPDGEFGPNTRAAIKRFQGQNGSVGAGFLTAPERAQLFRGQAVTAGSDSQQQAQREQVGKGAADQSAKKAADAEAAKRAADETAKKDAEAEFRRNEEEVKRLLDVVGQKEISAFVDKPLISSLRDLAFSFNGLRESNPDNMSNNPAKLAALANTLEELRQRVNAVQEKYRNAKALDEKRVAIIRQADEMATVLSTEETRGRLSSEGSSIVKQLKAERDNLTDVEKIPLPDRPDPSRTLADTEDTLAKLKPFKAAPECDLYIASPFDPQNHIDTNIAISACEAAVLTYPSDSQLNYELGQAYLRANNNSQAAVQYRKSADRGFAPAQSALGYLYLNGLGLPKDDARALEWYRKAAEQGSVAGQFNLGYMLQNGLGGPKDETQAANWYRKAAELLYAPAEFNLGVMYQNGRGVSRDLEQATVWYRRAAEQGFAPAQANLKHVLELVEAEKQGSEYARESPTSWKSSQQKNEMTDRVDVTVRSIQKNQEGAVIEIEGKCAEAGLVVFTALVVDRDGKPTIEFPTYTRENQFLWGDGPPQWGTLLGSRRINSDTVGSVSFPDEQFSNKFIILVLADKPPSKAPADTAGSQQKSENLEDVLKALPNVMYGMKLGLTGPQPLETTWRALIQFTSTKGDILIRVPLFDLNIRKLIDSCRVDH
jgi:TPR repeat protein/uncharacterized protein